MWYSLEAMAALAFVAEWQALAEQAHATAVLVDDNPTLAAECTRRTALGHVDSILSINPNKAAASRALANCTWRARAVQNARTLIRLTRREETGQLSQRVASPSLKLPAHQMMRMQPTQ
eukprot:SAG11_NODE_5039_length_1683_cov_1.442551_2_plen_119_part_00